MKNQPYSAMNNGSPPVLGPNGVRTCPTQEEARRTAEAMNDAYEAGRAVGRTESRCSVGEEVKA